MTGPPVAARICAGLNRAGARYLVIGATGGILHGHVRPTEDLDLLIARSADNVRRVLGGLAAAGYGFARTWPVEEVLRRPVTVIGADPAVNLFTLAGGLRYDDAASRAVRLDADGVEIPVAGVEDLIGAAVLDADREALGRLGA